MVDIQYLLVLEKEQERVTTFIMRWWNQALSRKLPWCSDRWTNHLEQEWELVLQDLQWLSTSEIRVERMYFFSLIISTDLPRLVQRFQRFLDVCLQPLVTSQHYRQRWVLFRRESHLLRTDLLHLFRLYMYQPMTLLTRLRLQHLHIWMLLQFFQDQSLSLVSIQPLTR